MRLSIQRAGIPSSGGYGCRRLLPTAVLPNSPFIRGGIVMAVPRHRGKLPPIRGHRNGYPVFILRDSRAGCRTAVLPNSPRAQGVIDMAAVAAGATHHRASFSPLEDIAMDRQLLFPVIGLSSHFA